MNDWLDEILIQYGDDCIANKGVYTYRLDEAKTTIQTRFTAQTKLTPSDSIPLKQHQAELLQARIDQMHYVDQRLIGKDTSGDRVFYDKDAVIAENRLKQHQRVISDAMKAELAQLETKE